MTARWGFCRFVQKKENKLDFYSIFIQSNRFQEQEIKIESVCLLHENGVRLFSLQSRLRPEMFTDFLNHTKKTVSKKCQISRFPKGHLNFYIFSCRNHKKQFSPQKIFFISWRVNHVKMMQKDRIGLNFLHNSLIRTRPLSKVIIALTTHGIFYAQSDN